MRTVADEDYLKEIYALELDHGHVTTSMLADSFTCSPATVTGMLKKLAHLEWVVYEPYHGVKLTPVGKEIALEVIRHHRLIETYLSLALDIPWERVHAEADLLEHALSEYLEERIDSLLGHPSFDPHGSPIPSREGTISDSGRLRLSDLPENSQAEVLEIRDRDPELLIHLDKLNLLPHTRLRVLHKEPIDGLITIQVEGMKHVLGRISSSQIIVRLIS
jgi:DtxR family transcriptional regulator, Mn-dependent transcriptional regulator